MYSKLILAQKLCTSLYFMYAKQILSETVSYLVDLHLISPFLLMCRYSFKTRPKKNMSVSKMYALPCHTVRCVKKETLHFDIVNHKYMPCSTQLNSFPFEDFVFWHLLYSVSVTMFYLQNVCETLC